MVTNFIRPNRHLAGIIPVSGQPLDFKMPWPDALMPLNQNYTLVEAAVVSCAFASCNTIWIVCDDDTAPLLRERIGEWVIDPFGCNASYRSEWGWTQEKFIPIFYVPIKAKDYRTKRNIGWSALWGAKTARTVASKISKWTIPTSNLVVFPYGLYAPEAMYQYRDDLREERRVYFTHEVKTVKDNEFLPFTFLKDDTRAMMENFEKSSTGAYQNRRVLPVAEQYSGKHFGLDKVFEPAIVDRESQKIELYWYYNAGSWKGYREYFASSYELERPDTSVLSYREMTPIWNWNKE